MTVAAPAMADTLISLLCARIQAAANVTAINLHQTPKSQRIPPFLTRNLTDC
jgi:hypothetical protein